MTLAPPSRPFRVVGCTLLAAIVCVASAPATAPASDYRPIDDFQEVDDAAAKYAAEFGPEHVLVVVDIDNTILANNQSLGSEQWFDWQEYLLEHEPNSPHLVAKTRAGVLEINGLIYTLGRMHPPQKNLPAIIKSVQARGIATIVLTSRGDEFREATEAEFARNDFDFTRSALPVRDESAEVYEPYDPADPAKCGLTPEEVTAWKLEKPRGVSYKNGIMMTAGQHKGAMLVTLLNRSDRDVKAVVFADNRPDNNGAVFAALTARKLEIAALIYRAEDDEIKEFEYGDKDDVTRRWKKLNRTLEAVFD